MALISLPAGRRVLALALAALLTIPAAAAAAAEKHPPEVRPTVQTPGPQASPSLPK